MIEIVQQVLTVFVLLFVRRLYQENTSNWCSLQCIQQRVGPYKDPREERYCCNRRRPFQAVVRKSLWITVGT